MEIKGSNTEALSKLEINDDIFLIGPLGASVELNHKSNLLLIGEDISNTSLWNIANEYKNLGANVTHLSILKKIKPDFYNKQFYKYLTNSEVISYEKFSQKIENYDFQKYDTIILSMNEQDANKIKIKHSNVLIYMNNIMQCMMGGVCGSCIKKSGDIFLFTCIKQIL